MPPLPRIPVTLVTGFLGSGKTTFLLRLAEQHPQEQILFLVNEFAPDNMDGLTLSATGRPTHSVVGGSLFCECKAADFVRLMREEVCQLYAGQAITQAVIETSGIADPSAIGRLMQDHGLDAHFSIRRIVNIVSPLRFPQLHANLASVQAQVLACDTIIINQTDLASVAQIEHCRQLLAAANPAARLLRAEHCHLPFALNEAPTRPPLPDAPLATGDSNPFTTATAKFDQVIATTALQAWLNQLPTTVLRVKGHVETSEGWREVQRTVGGSAITPTNPQSESRLVVITHERDQATLDQEVRQLAALGVA